MARTLIDDLRVILLTGEEFQRLERLAELVDDAVDPATRDFNYDVYYPQDMGKSSDVRNFADVVLSFPMMAQRRVIVVRFFDGFKPEVRKKIAEAIQNVPESTLVIIEGEKTTLSPKPAGNFRNETFKPVYESQLPLWIRERFRLKGKRISDSAIALLMNNVGTVLLELESEIVKITTIVDDRESITEEDVERIVGKFRRHTVYAFCNAVGVGDFAEASRILRSLMEMEKNKETWYVSALAGHLMKIAEYHTLVRSGVSKDEAQKTLTAVPFLWKINRYEEQVRKFAKPETIRRALSEITKADSDLKRSVVDKELLVELLLPRVMP